MPRPIGARNKDFAAKRHALLGKLTDHAVNSDLRRPSLRQFAMAAGASEPTLRHYFADRKGLVVAILEEIGRRGAELLETTAGASTDPATAISEYFSVAEAGMQHGGFVRAHAFGIIEGVADAGAAKAYLANVLEPATAAISAKLKATPGAPRDEKALKAASIAALSPLLVMSLHQDLLGGADSDPIDVVATIDHIRGWLGAGISK